MKTLTIVLSLAMSSTTFAGTCESTLLESVNKDTGLKIVKMLDSYECGANACAVTFENDFSPYPNMKILSFLDVKNGVQVNWVPVANLIGHQTIKKNRNSYVELSQITDESLVVKASIETPRDSLFWPPQRTFFKETLNCKKK